MKRSFKSKTTLWLAIALIVAVDQASAFGPQVARSLEVNGISDMFGHKSAFFVLTQPDVWANPRGFMLAEGKSQYGIKLLAVDAMSGHVRIERDGLKQSLRLHSTVDLPPVTVLLATGDMSTLSAQGEGGLSGNIDPNNLSDDRLAGNPGYGSLPAINQSSQPGNTAPDPASTPISKSNPASSPVSNSNGVNPAIALQDQSQTEWYQQSLNIEQQRVETAQQVLAGEMTPWPRTPLTPPGTPNALVDPKAFYSNHIPGYRQPASF